MIACAADFRSNYGVMWAGFLSDSFRIYPNVYKQKLKRFCLKGYQEIHQFLMRWKINHVSIFGLFFLLDGVKEPSMYLDCYFCGDKSLGFQAIQLFYNFLSFKMLELPGFLLVYFLKTGNNLGLVIWFLFGSGCGAAYYVYTVYEFLCSCFWVGLVNGGWASLFLIYSQMSKNLQTCFVFSALWCDRKIAFNRLLFPYGMQNKSW